MAEARTSGSQQYEALIILKTIGTEPELAQAVTQLEDVVKKSGGTISGSTSWGRRRLAYRINKQAEGQYHVVDFAAPAAQLGEIKRLYGLNEQIIRYLILNRTREPVPAKPEPRPETPGMERESVGSGRGERYGR